MLNLIPISNSDDRGLHGDLEESVPEAFLTIHGPVLELISALQKQPMLSIPKLQHFKSSKTST
jgi:hypothetical protein